MIHVEKTGEDWALVSPLETAADEAAIGTILDALQNLETEDVVNENVTDFKSFGLTPQKLALAKVMRPLPKAKRRA